MANAQQAILTVVGAAAGAVAGSYIPVLGTVTGAEIGLTLGNVSGAFAYPAKSEIAGESNDQSEPSA